MALRSRLISKRFFSSRSFVSGTPWPASPCRLARPQAPSSAKGGRFLRAAATASRDKDMARSRGMRFNYNIMISTTDTMVWLFKHVITLFVWWTLCSCTSFLITLFSFELNIVLCCAFNHVTLICYDDIYVYFILNHLCYYWCNKNMWWIYFDQEKKNDFFNQTTKFVKLKLACKPKKQQLDNKAELGWS